MGPKIVSLAALLTVALSGWSGDATAQSQSGLDRRERPAAAPAASASESAASDAACISGERPVPMATNTIYQTCGLARFFVINRVQGRDIYVSLDGERKWLDPGEKEIFKSRCEVIYYAPRDKMYMLRIICK